LDGVDENRRQSSAETRPPAHFHLGEHKMRTMKAVEVGEAGGPLQLVERQVPEPGAGHVLIKVQACGVCHSDSLTKEGPWPGLEFPRVPGHEIAGVIDSVGAARP
jgi:D-arabinose 1-dehydrogenase-like Zn-dependent alcohol dehydrogenase